MALLNSSLAKICNSLRDYVDTLGEDPTPSDWEVNVTIGAPGINVSSMNNTNTINLFFYRFEHSGFDADAMPTDIQYLRIMCFITAFGVDEDTDDDDAVELNAGFNELKMLSQVMRLFQENPVLLMEGDDENEFWHTQFIHRPLADEQINQIWSSQGDTIYRPSLVYEIALAPIEPLKKIKTQPLVASYGVNTSADMGSYYNSWPVGRDLNYPAASSISIDTANPKWAPAAVMVTGPDAARTAELSLNYEVPVVGGNADFSSFPQIDIWIAGDTVKSGDLAIVGQLYESPRDNDNEEYWNDINPLAGLSADAAELDLLNLPLSSPDTSAVAFILNQTHWTGIDNTKNNWQLQIFVERYLQQDPYTNEWLDVAEELAELRIRSNPLLITLNRETV